MLADIEKSYNRDGLTLGRARDCAMQYRALHQPDASTEESFLLWGQASSKVHSDCFYLNSSDGLAALRSLTGLQDKRILTIASAGDAAQLFLFLGAAQVEMVDMSLPGVLFNELKLAGLSLLDFARYQELFSIARIKEKGAWLDLAVYFDLRSALSIQARVFFDILVNYPTGDDAVLRHYNRSFVRTRRDHSVPRRCPQTIDTLFGEAEYESLQQIARARPPILRFGSVSEYLSAAQGLDVVYLSNVGYLPMKTVDLALAFLEAGVKTVWMAISPERAFFQSDDCGGAQAYSLLRENATDGLPVLPEQESSEWLNRNLFLPHDRGDWLKRLGRRRLLKLGDTEATVLGLDPSVEFGLMLQMEQGDEWFDEPEQKSGTNRWLI